jgi:hypothetical protein
MYDTIHRDLSLALYSTTISNNYNNTDSIEGLSSALTRTLIAVITMTTTSVAMANFAALACLGHLRRLGHLNRLR